jgi:diguanylate cyclase (GGDEF)-like protein
MLHRVRPKGRSLPEDTWNRRHRGIVIVLFCQAVGLLILAVQPGHGITRGLLEGCLVALPGLVALWKVSKREFRDSVTGLATRPMFVNRVAHALTRAERENGQIAVLFLDLDHFKTINDSLGHAAGDQLIFAVARRLRARLRANTTIARLGGDEFAICLEDSTSEQAKAVADRVLAELRRPLLIQDKELFVDGSIGIAMSDHTGDGAEELLRNADTAMYEAKRLGRGRHAMFDAGMLRDVIDHLDLHADLQRAIIRDELVLHYQPIVALGTGEITGVEGLLRWNHPTRGMVQPAAFIPLAEETGLIVPIGRWVLNQACHQASRWHQAHPDRAPLTVTVNVSGRQLQQPDFVSDVADALRASHLQPSALVLEITESVLIQDSESMIDKLEQLKALGLRIAIDDFGTGYSSLSYLQRFPVDILKIDRSFVSPAGGPKSDTLALVRAIVQLSQTLQLRTVAEGVEDANQLAQMRRVGCDSGQGFLFARPIDADGISSLLTDVGSLAPARAREVLA